MEERVDEAGPEVAAMRLGFADRLLEVIDSGRRTATYKLALLLALIDLCSRRSDGDGHAPSMLYTKDIAEQVVMIYWPQVIPYKPPGASDALVLSKISLPRATIISAVRQFREMAEAAGAKWSPRAPAGRNLPHSRPAHAELRGQLTLGRETSVLAQLAARDHLVDAPGHHVANGAGILDPGDRTGLSRPRRSSGSGPRASRRRCRTTLRRVDA
jgi:hypothetical protein